MNAGVKYIYSSMLGKKGIPSYGSKDLRVAFSEHVINMLKKREC